MLFRSGGVDDGAAAMGWSGWAEAAGGVVMERGGEADSGEDGNLWGIGLGDGVWPGKSGDGLASWGSAPPA